MNRCLVLLLLAGAILLQSCEDGKIKIAGRKIALRDLSITPRNAFANMFLDSTTMEQFIANEKLDTATAQHMRSFYNSRNYQYAWFDKRGINDPGMAFWNQLNGFIGLSNDSSLFDAELAAQMDQFDDGEKIKKKDKAAMDLTELKLTRQFFRYAAVAYEGRLNPEDLQWFIPKRKVDPLALLDSLVAHDWKRFEEWEPLNSLYKNLKKQLAFYNDIAHKGGWQPLPELGKKTIKPGTPDPIIPAMKQRLLISGDLKQADTSTEYSAELLEAVKKAQRRYGFHEDGVIDQALITALNVPVKDRIEQILINMERMRWLPETPAPTRIVANIPEFRIHVFEDGKKAFDMDIVVGKQGNNTVIFNNQLKYIVFSPYWNVPASIVRNEILPAMNSNPNYLASQNMEQEGERGGLPVIRQRPGPGNALGRVKFLFPNNHNIYFHDTPAKSLFSREKRAFSHGCMRLADAEKMAQYLLRNDPEWSPEKIRAAMNASTEKWVTLKTPIPVYVSYFTAWVDGDGLLNFREDIYQHDARMAERMFIGHEQETEEVAAR